MRDWRMLAASVATAGAVVIFAATLAHATFFDPEQEIAAPSLAAAAPSKDAQPGNLPVRLIIPSLNIDANVQYAGIAYSGNIGVPDNFTDVAWYKYGTVPGFDGDAIIDGHVDNAISLPGVFKHLDTIQKGADIYVETASSTKLDFKVTDVETYDVADVPIATMLQKTGGAYLTLITCDGTWQENQKEYNERLVVYAELVK